MLNSSFAQKGKVVSALNFKEAGKLEQAFKTIQTTIDKNNEKSAKSINWPRTWEVRGEIYQAVFHSKDEKIKALSTDPLTEALNSYKRALELDTKNKFSKSVKIKLTLLNNDFQDQAVEAYNLENYSKALVSFEQILEINNLPLFKTDNLMSIDTAIIYNAGMMALKTDDSDKAVRYFREAARHGYNGATTYLWLSRAYEQKKDTINASESLKQGFEKYPENNELLSNMIQLYLNMDRKEEAMHFLELAISREPDKAVYYLAMGNLLDKNHDNENAIISYEKAIELDTDLFMGYFNLGVIYYNEGVQLFESAKNIPSDDSASYEKVIKEVDKYWEKSLPFMEKCYELNPEDAATVESIKSLYYRLNQMDKYNAIQKNSTK
ncbi:MAG: tetratricopeptide repeat protein [Prolixibacteraceae bacterium]|nr:tetratricopeptide repeat protein [Prolixibacteraceae bacterium]MBT6998988.1 tetratricopeptide repeat protein [Prolixibacteraceae bacterium]MBT7394254.1 tetratricopeptide repeat protein [Prolixibacteraceae bacterium]